MSRPDFCNGLEHRYASKGEKLGAEHMKLPSYEVRDCRVARSHCHTSREREKIFWECDRAPWYTDVMQKWYHHNGNIVCNCLVLEQNTIVWGRFYHRVLTQDQALPYNIAGMMASFPCDINIQLMGGLQPPQPTSWSEEDGSPQKTGNLPSPIGKLHC